MAHSVGEQRADDIGYIELSSKQSTGSPPRAGSNNAGSRQHPLQQTVSASYVYSPGVDDVWDGGNPRSSPSTEKTDYAKEAESPESRGSPVAWHNDERVALHQTRFQRHSTKWDNEHHTESRHADDVFVALDLSLESQRGSRA